MSQSGRPGSSSFKFVAPVLNASAASKARPSRVAVKFDSNKPSVGSPGLHTEQQTPKASLRPAANKLSATGNRQSHASETSVPPGGNLGGTVPAPNVMTSSNQSMHQRSESLKNNYLL